MDSHDKDLCPYCNGKVAMPSWHVNQTRHAIQPMYEQLSLFNDRRKSNVRVTGEPGLTAL